MVTPGSRPKKNTGSAHNNCFGVGRVHRSGDHPLMHKLFSAIVKLFLLLALMALASCNLPALGKPVSTPTASVFINTLAAARTEAVQSVYQTLTQAALIPSATPALTVTVPPAVKKSKTPAAPAATRTAAPTKKPSPTPNAYKCFIASVSPTSGTSITSGKNFDFKVTLKNDGTATWKPATVDFTYLSGPKFQKTTSTEKLTGDILPGESVKLLVDMAATSSKGTQNINWALELNNGASYFCYVGITVKIK